MTDELQQLRCELEQLRTALTKIAAQYIPDHDADADLHECHRLAAAALSAPRAAIKPTLATPPVEVALRAEGDKTRAGLPLSSSTPPTRPVAGEGETKPVAWRIQTIDGQGLFYAEGDKGSDLIHHASPWWTTTPLYVAPPPPAEASKPESEALRDIAVERGRQVSAYCWSPEHDDEHDHGELAKAAACYAVGYRIRAANLPDASRGTGFREGWVWPPGWSFNPDDRRRELIKAGALIVAEIERLDRALPTPAKGGA